MTALSHRKGRALRLNQVSAGTELIFHIILGLFAACCILPFLFVVIISFSAESSIKTIGYSFVPAQWSLEAYRQVFKLGDQLWLSYFNSFFITIVGTVVSVAICVLYAYPLFRKDFKLRGFFTFFSFFTMIFGGGLIPTYIVCKNLLGMSNNYAALIVPMLVNPFNIIIMRTFFQTTVPDAIIESAKIDGARQIRIFVQIVLPISLPAIATIGLFYTFAYWNDWMMAKYYLNSNAQNLFPLQYVLISLESNIDFLTRNQQFMGPGEASNIPSETIRMAMVMVGVIPIACSYPFFQKYFISGLTIGAVKG